MSFLRLYKFCRIAIFVRVDFYRRSVAFFLFYLFFLQLWNIRDYLFSRPSHVWTATTRIITDAQRELMERSQMGGWNLQKDQNGGVLWKFGFRKIYSLNFVAVKAIVVSSYLRFPFLGRSLNVFAWIRDDSLFHALRYSEWVIREPEEPHGYSTPFYTISCDWALARWFG